MELICDWPWSSYSLESMNGSSGTEANQPPERRPQVRRFMPPRDVAGDTGDCSCCFAQLKACEFGQP